MTWVIADHTPTAAGELSVQKGQQVEVLEMSAARADWCLVRAQPAEGTPAREGLVPAVVLKPQPGQPASPSRRAEPEGQAGK